MARRVSCYLKSYVFINSLDPDEMPHFVPFIKVYIVCSVHFVLFDLILYVPSKIFQLCRDVSSLVEPVLS